MPRTVSSTSKYRLHKASAQAIVTLSGRDFYLGPYRSAASKTTYNRLVGEWLAAGRCLPKNARASDVTIIELCAAYLRHARSFSGTNGGSLDRVRIAIRTLRQTYGSTLTGDFGPLALQAVQAKLASTGRCRRYVNHIIAEIKRMFRCAASQELVPVSAH
jgi:hypothetical protein